jgi:V/A-type H+-transporting ATPase subunit A
MMQVTGEEGVSIADYVTYQKALFVDMVFLQQDAFDKVDASVPIERQHLTFERVYERAGMFRTADGSHGSLTMIGSVSPAGGNFEEPVTQSTLSTVKTFLGLSYDRAYKRFYPAIDPLISWSRYLDQLADWYGVHIDPSWVARVKRIQELLRQGDRVQQMMQVTGEEGVSIADYVTYQKALFVDMVFLQQDAFDKVDASVPIERQQMTFERVYELVHREYDFAGKEAAREFFIKLTGLLKNFNYAAPESPDYKRLLSEVTALADEATLPAAADHDKQLTG